MRSVRRKLRDTGVELAEEFCVGTIIEVCQAVQKQVFAGTAQSRTVDRMGGVLFLGEFGEGTAQPRYKRQW